MNQRRSGFTLIEILVVLGIIALLAAILFPAFSRAQESARQTTCQSNLQQIYFAVSQYRKDEGRYPDTMVDLLAEGASYSIGTVTAPAPLGNNAPGYLKAGQDTLICKDDDGPADVARSSYGSLSKVPPASPLTTPIVNIATPASSFNGDLSQFVWNYWGYRNDGFNYRDETEAQTAIGTTCAPATPCPNLLNPTANYDRRTNPIKFSMSNRFAPSSTIITHCIHHRLPTADNLNSAGELYLDPTNSKNARDIVLRLDGVVKAVDVSLWQSQNIWQKQTP
jgi:prepilin-type N-terminal cleavage/methylation domain-containing protein